jgi:hypothetical protein
VEKEQGSLMRKHYSLELSDKVLDKLFQIFDNDEYPYIVVECWSNNREQGYSLACYNTSRRICFAMQRNSDDVVVYDGDIDDFDISTNHPMTEKIWNRGKCFSEIDDAVAYIVEKTGIIEKAILLLP